MPSQAFRVQRLDCEGDDFGFPRIEGIVGTGGQIDHVGAGTDLKQCMAEIQTVDRSKFDVQNAWVDPVHFCVINRFLRSGKARETDKRSAGSAPLSSTMIV